MIRGLIRNIRDNWKEIGDIGKEYSKEGEEHWKLFRKKKTNKK